MAKFQLIKVLVVVLLVLAVIADAQQQQQSGGKRKKGQQQQVEQNSRPHPGKGQKQNQNQNPSQTHPNKNKATKNKKKQPLQEVPLQQNKFVVKDLPNLGRIRGRIFKSQWTGKSIIQFLDIPYGKAPVGNLRFKASVPADPWKNTFNAHKPHPGCPSLQILHKYDSFEVKNIDVEDCLRLTVSTKTFNGKLPVMVYIHGDLLYDGGSQEAAPGYLLEQDIVLVSVRYRLGPFGFLSTMTEEIPGNAAVFDIILALQWIQNHIAAFGGDPKRVTLFGEVGGAALINVLTMSPVVSDGLFHRVIYQSGSALSPAFITDKPVSASRDIARRAGCKGVGKAESINKCIRKLNSTELLEAFNAHGSELISQGIGSYGGMQIVIGGPSGVLPQHPGKLLASRNYKGYPTMGGSVKNAGTFILKDIFIESFNQTIIDDKFDGPAYISLIINQTNGADPTGAWKNFAEEEIFNPADIRNGTFYRMLPGLIDLCSTIPFKNPVLLALQANSKKLPNSTYLYSFDYEGEANRYMTEEDDNGAMPFELGVSLTDELLYLFPWPRTSMLNTMRDLKIAKRLVSFWTSFAATGVPKAPGVPAWPAMQDETGPYINIDKTIQISDNYLDEYSIAVKDAQKGLNLVNDEYFESLVDIPEGGEQEGEEGEGEEEEEEEDGAGDEDDEDIGNDNEQEFDGQQQHQQGRRANGYFIVATKSRGRLY